jgi:hypothetical protein
VGLYPDYATVFLPPILHSDVQRAAQDVAIVRKIRFIINYSSIMRIACGEFNFFNGKHVGRTLEVRDDHEGPKTMFLVLYYQRDSLHIGLAGIWWDWEMFFTEIEDTYLQCGEAFRRVRVLSVHTRQAH